MSIPTHQEERQLRDGIAIPHGVLRDNGEIFGDRRRNAERIRRRGRVRCIEFIEQGLRIDAGDLVEQYQCVEAVATGAG
jgi:hypothetical protein